MDKTALVGLVHDSPARRGRQSPFKMSTDNKEQIVFGFVSDAGLFYICSMLWLSI